MARDFAKGFYNSKEWKRKREYILMRDKYVCQRCGDTGDLEVHHRTRLSARNINDPSITLNDDNLITLCKSCHFEEHERDKARANSERSSNRDTGDEYEFNSDGFLVLRTKK